MREKLIELICQAQDCGCDVTDVVEMNYVENDALADHLIANGVTIPVRCKDCKHYMAEEKERCEAMRATPYGLCLKHRPLPLAGYHEYRNQDDFCSYGERRTDETSR